VANSLTQPDTFLSRKEEEGAFAVGYRFVALRKETHCVKGVKDVFG
jgi:hypothetical protein